MTFTRAGREVSLKVRVGLVTQLAMGSEIRFWVYFYISESRTYRRLTFCAGTKFSVRASKNTCI